MIGDLALEIFRFIDDYKNVPENDGNSPSVREIMAGLEYTSPAPIQAQLNKLRQRECIDWLDQQPRTIRRLKSLKEVEAIVGQNPRRDHANRYLSKRIQKYGSQQ